MACAWQFTNMKNSRNFEISVSNLSSNNALRKVVAIIKASQHTTLYMALTYSEYPFLKELELEEENKGVYNGKWCGSGEFLTSVSPTTAKPIAR